ncbi:MAG TPA: amino acid adenylation domain-containing protein [Jatrophihabitantaceae bacterium]|jgi:amino acid adenylation domain-containing protein
MGAPAVATAKEATATRDILASVLDHSVAAPHRPAAKDGLRELTYGELRDAAATLAAGLTARGVTAGDRVALQLPNSVDFLVSALACLWVGAIFVPLAATDPPARIAGVVDDCDPTLVLANPGIAQWHPRAVDLADVSGSTTVAPIDPADRPAYAIYTSGTTGTPKGVVIGRQAFATAVWSWNAMVGLDADTRAMCVSPFHFDGSFATLFPPIAAGGSLVIPSRDSLLFPRYFFRTLTRERITLTGFSPSYLRLLLPSKELAGLADTELRILPLGGEACSPSDVALLWEAAPQLRVFNRYGPTETTIAVSHFEITPDVIAGGGAVPIGQPHPGSSFHLIDGDGGLIDEPDHVGELYIGGEQLMAGYWGAPDLTAQVLRTDVIPGQTLYRTGDLVRRDHTGNYIYVDRADRVVKRNAVRISLVELGEVVRGLPGVTAATCVAFDNDGDLGIAAFVVGATPSTPAELRRATGERLPATMLPDSFHVVDALPMTSSNKVDERRLLADAGLRAS